VKFGHVGFEICVRADRHTETIIAVLRIALGGEVTSRETRSPASFSVRPNVITADGSAAAVVAGRRVSVLSLARLVTLAYTQRFFGNKQL